MKTGVAWNEGQVVMIYNIRWELEFFTPDMGIGEQDTEILYTVCHARYLII